ncbi:hypothetical protein GPECTOR_45g141 [Gonium pectorale]|uniref:HSP70 protein n=1 Tax=Gonium pectorale TaxID=33097 RepID=A0A150G8X9_GONPE|nr:hypothetical protein GPECTOR_45g141 [Gonium pectorale]|eukprot:KXZ46271.1 hypothetical protein GPECTOR_45g141 [Gonium pectorale]
MASRELFLGFVGIDFGTANSGFSYMPVGEVRPVCFTEYPQNRAQYPKTRTALLYRLEANGAAERTPIAWGEEAYHAYLGLRPAERSSHLYLENFKLALAPEGNMYADMPKLKAARLTVEKVIADYLRCLSDFAKKIILGRYDSWPFGATRWALTVPAAWGDAAKALMRSAAVMAGIVPDINSTHLVLVHEPEAAALACQSRKDVTLSLGDTFLIVDAGGGTIDITWHEVVRDDEGKLHLEDAAHREGITYGGRRLDEDFEKLLQSSLGGSIFSEWKANPKSGGDLLELIYGSWQRIKHNYDGSSSEQYIAVQLPNSLVRKLPDDMTEQFDKLLGWDDRFPLKVSEVKRMFDGMASAVGQKVAAMKGRIPGRKAPTKVLIVGGTGSNPYFIKRLRESLHLMFNSNLSITAPTYGFAAIVEGGALYAKDPLVISARRTTRTYGIRSSAPAEPDSPSEYVTFNEFSRVKYCSDYLNVFVSKNSKVPVDHKVQKIFNPIVKEQEVVEFVIYATEEDGESQRYCSRLRDAKTAQLATVSITIDDPKKVIDPKAYQLDTSLTFGQTELQVRVVDLQTRRVAETKIAFTLSF